MVLGTFLLNIQHYKVRIKGKVEQSRERSGAIPYVVGIERGAFRSPSTTVINFTYFTFTWPIDGTLTGSSTPGQSEPDSIGNEEVFRIPGTPGMEPHYQMQFNVISRTLNGFK